MSIIDLSFTICGTSIPVDHGYPLFAAVSQVVPALHKEDTCNCAIHPILGSAIGERKLRVGPNSRLTVRIPSESIALYLGLCGKALTVGGEVITIGVPEVRPLTAASSLASRMVTIKNHMEAGSFLTAAAKELASLKIIGSIGLVSRTAPGSVEGRAPEPGQPTRDPFIRRTLRIKDKEIVGFALTVNELSPEDSLKLQEIGLGGRRHFGCGVFVAAK